MRRRSLLVLTLLLLPALCGRAAAVIRHIGTGDGLPNSFVMDLAIDDRGMVWAATENGLARIAGDSFTVWNTDNSSILDNKIIRLFFEPGTRSLWCQTMNNGFSILDSHTAEFSVFNESNGLLSNALNGVFPAQDGGVWIATKSAGLQHYDPLTHQSRYYTPENCPGLEADIRCCAEDRYGHLYLGYNHHGFGVLDLETRTVRNYAHVPGDPASLPGDVVRRILIDSAGNVWAGTNQGLGLFDRINGTFQNYRHDGKDDRSLAGDNIMGLAEMSDHTLWVSSDLGGISILDLRDDAHTTGFRRITDEDGLSSINIRCTLQDGYGNVWVANYASGVDFITENATPFNILPFYRESGSVRQLKRVYAICSDADGNLWLGGENELSLFRDGRHVRTWDLSPYLVQTYTIPYALLSDRDGNVWIGLNDEGVLKFNPRNGSFRRISSPSQLMDVHALLEDPDGRIWIGSEVGIYSADKDVMSFEERFVKGDGTTTVVYSLQRDALGRFWVGTLGDGLFVFREDGDLVAEFNTASGFCSDNINQVYCDHEGEFWIATYAGLVHFPDPTDLGRYEVFDGKNGLLNVNVRAVQEDAMGGIWVSTYDGIATLLRREQLFESYSFFNGVQIGSFVESSATRTPDGNLYFGSPEGVCYFSPRQMGASRSVSPLHFVDGWKSDRDDNDWVPLLADLSKGRVLLGHKENTIRLEFAIEDFSQTDRVEYSYRLPGVIEDWLSNGNSGRLFLWGLKPGNHRLQVRARLKDQTWEQGETSSLLIRVRPSVWASWPARVVYGLLLAAILFFIFRYLRLLLSLRLERENRRKEQELSEERLRFFTNITHELRTPLTLILGPLEDLVHDKNLPEPYADRIAGIHRSGMRLHGLINQILEFRKTQTQTKRLVVREGDLGRLVESIGARYREMNRNSATEIRVDVRETFDAVYFDPDIVSTILENLMSNAVKYTPRGSITLSLYGEEMDGERYCTMSVTDTGYGISEAELPQIFDRYYQVKGAHQASGTGIGLALVKALTDVHQGVLKVSSREGRGSTFSFSILRDSTYPEAEHAAPSSVPSGPEHLPDDAGADERSASSTQPLILVVEDDVDILRYVSSALSGRYAVVTATDGRKGLEMALDRIPDMIISDIMMPVMDGIELCRMVKADIRTSHIPVILLTAKDTLQDKETGYESGADSYLTKPFTSRLLLSRIANLFEMRRRLADRLVREGGDTPGPEAGTGTETLNECDREFIARFDRLIEDNMDKEDLDMGFITASFNMSYSTFYRKVKGLLGISAKEYIRTRKMRRAMDLLRSGKYNVNEVSLMVGYQDTGNFRNYFRKEFGLNPSEVLKKGG